jgi:hypothetical protein
MRQGIGSVKMAGLLHLGNDMKIWYKPTRGPHRITDEITFMAKSQEELRAIAAFLMSAATMPSDKWDKYGHEHFIDTEKNKASRPNFDVIITRDSFK